MSYRSKTIWKILLLTKFQVISKQTSHTNLAIRKHSRLLKLAHTNSLSYSFSKLLLWFRINISSTAARIRMTSFLLNKLIYKQTLIRLFKFSILTSIHTRLGRVQWSTIMLSSKWIGLKTKLKVIQLSYSIIILFEWRQENQWQQFSHEIILRSR